MNDELSILIVDDDQGILETLFDILTELQFKVTTASDGYKAIDLVKGDSFDVILMDIKMPGIDGVETFKRIKTINPDACIIFMTAYALEERVAEAEKEGAIDILCKPLDIRNLEKVIRESIPC